MSLDGIKELHGLKFEVLNGCASFKAKLLPLTFLFKINIF